jgi:hypothetical protein
LEPVDKLSIVTTLLPSSINFLARQEPIKPAELVTKKILILYPNLNIILNNSKFVPINSYLIILPAPPVSIK